MIYDLAVKVKERRKNVLYNDPKFIWIFIYLLVVFGGLECIGHFFANVALLGGPKEAFSSERGLQRDVFCLG
jgi:hypothetical protein